MDCISVPHVTYYTKAKVTVQSTSVQTMTEIFDSAMIVW